MRYVSWVPHAWANDPGRGLAPDAKYAHLIGRDQFRSFSSARVQTILKSACPNEHAERRFAEVVAEAALGRFQGPWSHEYLQRQMLRAGGFVAKAFPIVQGDKVRRGDDWLRSGHNSTVWASDTPFYMGAPRIVAAARHCAQKSVPHLAAVDHEGAYRALPVRDPEECYTVLPGEEAGSVWQHMVLTFGATSSVWAYLRVADAVCFLSIVLLLPATAFVDDFFRIDGAKSAPVGSASSRTSTRPWDSA